MRKLLIISYWTGIVADALATVLLFSPSAAAVVFQQRQFEITPICLYVSRIAGALMLGWTVLLYWAQRRPIERAGVLLITLFPVVTLLTGAAVMVGLSGWIPVSNIVPLYILYAVVFCLFVPSYVWAKNRTGSST